MPTFSASYLESVSEKLLIAAGVPPDDARNVASSLIRSNLAGHDSHGLHVLPYYLDRIKRGVIKPGSRIEVKKETAFSALLNGNWNFGQLIASAAMEIGMRKAETLGFSVIGAFNCNHVGRLGDFCQPLAEKGLIAIMMVNAPPSVAPWGGIERKLGTNPICIAIPRVGSPAFVLDMSTAVVANGKVSMLVGTGERIPEGWAIDKKGNITTKPTDFEDGGAMLPLGKYKGYGLGLAVDMLSGAFTGSGGCDRMARDGSNGIFALIMKSDLFVSKDEFSSSVEGILNFVVDCRLQKGFSEVLVPGQPELEQEEKRRVDGIHVHDILWKKIERWSTVLGVNLEV